MNNNVLYKHNNCDISKENRVNSINHINTTSSDSESDSSEFNTESDLSEQDSDSDSEFQEKTFNNIDISEHVKEINEAVNNIVENSDAIPINFKKMFTEEELKQVTQDLMKNDCDFINYMSQLIIKKIKKDNWKEQSVWTI